MFFRREKTKLVTFDDRLSALKAAGFTVVPEGSGKARVSKSGVAAIIEDRGEEPTHVNKAGATLGKEIGLLVHGGYQMFWESASGKVMPALAPQLKALHEFEEDLKEGLGLTSLYNESLGTTCDQHMYDRIDSRDRGVPARPWDR